MHKFKISIKKKKGLEQIDSKTLNFFDKIDYYTILIDIYHYTSLFGACRHLG